MSIFSKNKSSEGTLVTFAKELQTEVNRGMLHGSITASDVKSMIGLEGMSPMVSANLESGASQGWDFVTQTAQRLGFGVESFTDAQIAAAKCIIAGAAAPAEYARQALTFKAVGTESIPLVAASNFGAGGSFDFRDEIHASLEAFDNTSLNQYIGYSIAFNIQAARQDAYSEAFYPTTVVTPDQGGLDITARLSTVFNEVRHSITGKPTDFNQRNLLEAVVDSSILAADSLKIVPYYLAGGGGSSANFVATARVPSSNATVETVTFLTGPLAINTKIDLLGVSQHPGLVATGVLDNTDALDGKIILSKIYIAVQAGAGGEEVIAFDTSKLVYSHFNKTAEGRDKRMGLQFTTSDLILDVNSRDVGAGTVAAFAAFNTLGYTVRLSVNVSGYADVEFGTVELNASTPVIALILDANGNVIDPAATGVPAAITALGPLAVIGYDLDARRTNSNRRTRGLMCNSQAFTERYQIPIGSPLSIPTPINSDTEAGDINTLVTAARIRNSNMAVTALLNYADTLKQYTSTAITLAGVVPNIAGIGRYFVTPYYAEQLNIDVTTLINSIQGHQRIADLRAAFVNLLRKHAYDAMQTSRYKIALDQLTGFVGKRPKLLVGTDPILAQYLMADGDSRLLGPDIDYQVEVSYDKRVRGTIYLTFIRPEETGPSPLNFGVHAWVPEMTSAVQVQRNGAIFKEVMVQPRNIHINTLPILVKLTVNMATLNAAVSEKTEAPTIIA